MDAEAPPPKKELSVSLEPPRDLPIPAADSANQEQGEAPSYTPNQLGAALDELAGMKSQFVNQMAVAAYHTLQAEADRSRDEVRNLTDSLHSSEKEGVRLNGIIDRLRERLTTQAIVLSLGGPSFGAGLAISVGGTQPVGGILIAVGVTLMLVAAGLTWRRG